MAVGGIIYVDAYDSFSNNIIALLAQVTAATVAVIKIDENVADLEILLAKYAAVVVGPGPGNPGNCQDVGLIPRILDAAAKHNIPVLGICLGFQTLCSSSGVPIDSLRIPCHGLSKKILHANVDIFYDVGPVLATCYNSLGVLVTALDDEIGSSRSDSPCSTDCSSTDTDNKSIVASQASPTSLIPLAQDSDGYLMAVRHPVLPQWGLQFHPESCKSSLACHQILKNWWALVLSWNRCSLQATRRASEIATSTPQECVIDRGLPYVPQINPAAEVLLKTSREDAIVNVFQHLLMLTKTTGSVLQSSPINSKLSLETIAGLCYTNSSRQKVAMLESTKKGRYSIYAIPSSATFSFEHSQGLLRVHLDGFKDAEWGMTARSCLDLVEQLISYRQVTCVRNAAGSEKARKATSDPFSSPFWGGFLGYLSYELGLDLLDTKRTSPPSTPDLALLWTERSIVVDHFDHTTIVQSIRQEDDAWINSMTKKMVNPRECALDQRDSTDFQEALRSSSYIPPNELDYKSRIAMCLQHLRAGNSYELCLTTEAQVRLLASENHAFQLYRNLRRCNPVPYAAYIHIADTTIVSSSPEQFLSWNRDGTIDMIPMKGTVRKTPSMTFERASAILASPKEQAENLMIADLIRHDLHSALGPRAKLSVEKLCAVEQHETVYQLVSHIRGQAPIAPDLSATAKQEKVIHYGHSVLRHALPPGSMTGAPKKRSCEILSQLEQRDRGVYSGVIGFFDVGGGGSWSVCIRSAFSTADRDADGMQTWRIGAGGAITVLSDPQAEWEEMQTKLQSVLRGFEPDENIA